MRSVIITLAAIALASLTGNAQEQDRDRVQDQDRTRLVALNGEMLQLRDRAELHLREQRTLSDGSVLYPNGKYVTPDGNKYRLKNGECLDGDGALYRNEYQYQHKVMHENTGLTPEQVRLRNQERVHYTLVGGEIYQIRDQEQVRLRENLQLGNGVTAFPDGSYQLRNEARVQLRDGECLGGDGQLYRNMYQYRKTMMKQLKAPMMNKMKKGVPVPMIPAKRKTTT